MTTEKTIKELFSRLPERGCARVGLFVLLFALFSPPFFGLSGALAGDVYYGAYANARPLHFLALPASAAVLGRGAVSASGAMDASDVFRFPVNTALVGGGQFFLGATGRDNAHALFAAATLPIFHGAALGLFTQSTPSDVLRAPNLLGLSAAKYFPEYNYGFGFSASVNRNDFWGEEEFFGAIGADFRFDPTDFLSWRAYFSGAGMPLGGGDAFNRRLAEQYGVIMNYGLYLGERGYWKADIGVGGRKTTWDGPFEIGFGAEFTAGGRYIMRLGYEAPAENILRVVGGIGYLPKYHLSPNRFAVLSGWGGGLGIRAGDFSADAAYRIDDGGAVWSVSAAFEVEELKKRSAAENLALASNHYKMERFGKSRLYASRAISGDSAMWEAGALYVKSRAELRRRSGASIALIYGGNSRGTVVPYPPSPDALGGLSRYAALVASLRERYRPNFTVDVGNLIYADKGQLRAEFAGRYYDAAGFDVLAPGIGELSMGPAKLAAALKRKIPIVITNLNDANAEANGIMGGALLTNGGYSVYLLNIIAELPPKDGEARLDLSYNPAAIRSLFNNGPAATADLRVAVVHGTLEEATRLTESLPEEFDVVIAGSLAQRLDPPIKVGKTLIVSAGAENKFVGCLFVRFSAGKRIAEGGKEAAAVNNEPVDSRFTAENVLFAVDQDIAPDPAVESVTRLVSAAIAVNRGDGSSVYTRVRGVIPHLSDRGGGARAFLKAAQSKSEYALGDSVQYCRRPLLSYAGNRAAFIFGNPEDNDGKLRMVDLKTGAGKTVSAGKNVVDAAFSPTDDFLYYIEADSGGNCAIRKTKMYMNDALTIIKADASQRDDLNISSDGATLLFASRHNDGIWDIYAVDTSGRPAPTRITDGKADHRRPRISPNGKYIAYLSNRNNFGGKTDLWVYDRSASKHMRLTTNTDVQDFTWDDASEAIYFSAGVNLLEICRVDMERRLIKNMIRPPLGAVKSWSESAPRFIRYNGEPMIVYTRIYADGRRRIYWYDLLSAKDAEMYSVGEFDEWTD